jgi:replicative DNA helicase
VTQTLPHSPGVEKSVICGCLLHDDIASDAVEILTPDDFYVSAHVRIFEAIQTLSRKDAPVTLVSVASHLSDSKTLSKVGGATYLSDLIDQTPIATNIQHYAEKLIEKRALREMIMACQRGSQECFGANGNAPEVLESTKRAISEVGLNSVKEKYLTMADVTIESIDRYETLYHTKQTHGIKTGFRTIDYVTGGLSGPKLIIIAARPSVGKTAFMGNWVFNMARSGDACGVFELEMGRDELDNRWFAMMTGINSAKLTTGNGLTKDDWQTVTRAAERKHEWPVMIDDTGGLTTAQIRRRAKHMVKDGAKIIFIDQLSKIGGNRNMSNWERNTTHVEDLGFLKKELGVPIVLLAQLNRNAEGKTNPSMSDLKSTGQLEEEADMVILGNRPYIYTKKEDDEHIAFWDIAKNRGGPTYKIDMRWDGRTTRFYEIEK